MDDMEKLFAQLDKDYPNWERTHLRAHDAVDVLRERDLASQKKLMQDRQRSFLLCAINAAIDSGVVRLPND